MAKKRGRPPKKKGVVRRAIVTPDKHFPIADYDAINIVCQAIELVKPDTYIDLGDTGEWEKFSKHYWRDRDKPGDDLYIPMINKEVELVNEGMDIIDKSLDKIKCKERHFIQGNHEAWLDFFVAQKPHLPQYKPENALRLKERGYTYWRQDPDVKLKIGKVNFTHGDWVPKHHAKKHLEEYGQSVIYGHTHDLQRFTKTGLDGTRSAWSLGCLKDMSSKKNKWLGGRPHNWNHAFGIVDWFSNGDYKVEVVEIINGRTTVWGHALDANE